MEDNNLSKPKRETNSLTNKQGVKLVEENYLSADTFNKLLALDYNDIMSKQTIKDKIWIQIKK